MRLDLRDLALRGGDRFESSFPLQMAPLVLGGVSYQVLLPGNVTVAVQRVAGGFLVKVGSVAHPMEDKHYIEWIQLITGDKAQRVFLKPGDKPEAKFESDADSASARELCNLHGLWKA